MKKLTLPAVPIFRFIIITSWVILFTLLLQRDVFIKSIDSKEIQLLQQAESEDFQSIYLNNKKIGYVHSRFSNNSDVSRLEQNGLMYLNVAESIQKIELQLTIDYSANNEVEDFTFSFTSPFYQMSADGKAIGNKIVYNLKTNSTTVSDSITFETPPSFASSRRMYLLTDNTVGEKRKLTRFDPITMTGKESLIEYKGQESLLIRGRVQKLHRFLEKSGGVRIQFWLNDNGIVVKEESPAGFVFIREPKFKALALNNSNNSEDILAAVRIIPKGDVKLSGDSTQYHLLFPEESEFDLDGGRQSFEGQTLTINKETLQPSILRAQCSATNNLQATPYIQVDNDEIISASSTITQGLTSDIEKVEAIASWVYEKLEKRSIIGLPDAVSTLQSGQGDCNEHAALFTALARAAGIPTRIATGVSYLNDGFYYHAWNEVCVNSNWISLDTTTNQLPADLGHIRFLTGELQEQTKILGLLGQLSIESIATEKGHDSSK